MVDDNRIPCGVVGVGYLGQHHARIYNELENCDLVGVYDKDLDRGKEIAEKNNCRQFDSIEELGKDCKAVSIAVPTDKHCEAALPLLESGCNLLIEKPICTSLAEAEKILAAAKKSGSIVQVGHIENYNPVMAYLEEAVDCPRFITSDRLAEFNIRGTEVGVVLDLMIHDIGVILNLVKSPIKKIDSVGVNVLLTTEDIANARITFENGCVANINTSRVSLKNLREIRIFQPCTYLSLDFKNQTGHLLKKQNGQLHKEEIPIEKDEPLKIEIASFVDCINRYSMPKVDAFLATTALEVAIQITEQIVKGIENSPGS